MINAFENEVELIIIDDENVGKSKNLVVDENIVKKPLVCHKEAKEKWKIKGGPTCINFYFTTSFTFSKKTEE